MPNPSPPISTPFEAMQQSAFDVITGTMGFAATWAPDGGGDEESATVLFQNPTEEMKIAGVDYDPGAWRMEYYLGDLPGLETAANARASKEVIVIEGTEYYVRKVHRKFDGKTFIAELQPKT